MAQKASIGGFVALVTIIKSWLVRKIVKDTTSGQRHHFKSLVVSGFTVYTLQSESEHTGIHVYRVCCLILCVW